VESEISHEESFEGFLDELLQIKAEAVKAKAILQNIKEIFEQLNDGYTQKEKNQNA